MTRVRVKRENTDTRGRELCDAGGRDGSDAATSEGHQGLLGAARPGRSKEGWADEDTASSTKIRRRTVKLGVYFLLSRPHGPHTIVYKASSASCDLAPALGRASSQPG